MDDELGDAMAFGTGYALYRHGQDRLAAQIAHGVRAALDGWEPIAPGLPEPPDILVADVRPTDLALSSCLEWGDFIGQEQLKQQLQIRVGSAGVRHGRLPHHLLVSPTSGMGRRTLARLAALSAGVQLVELVAPFGLDTLVSAVRQLRDKDVLFIDEIDRACEPGTPGATVLQRMVEERALPLAGADEEVYLPEAAIFATSTHPEQVAAPVRDCFAVIAELEPYSPVELARLAVHHAYRHRSQDLLDDEFAYKISLSSRGTPRSVERSVLAARDLILATGQQPTADEVAALTGIELW